MPIDLPCNALVVATCMTEPALSLKYVAQTARRISALLEKLLMVNAGARYGEPAHVFHAKRVLKPAAGMHIGASNLP